MTETIVRPRKTRGLPNHHFASTIWNELRSRDDIIVVQMLLGPDPDLEVMEASPWPGLRVLGK